MTGSFMARHRTICATLYEIKELAKARGDTKTMELCDEAILYARRMSIKLVEYKKASVDDTTILRG